VRFRPARSLAAPLRRSDTFRIRGGRRRARWPRGASLIKTTGGRAVAVDPAILGVLWREFGLPFTWLMHSGGGLSPRMDGLGPCMGECGSEVRRSCCVATREHRLAARGGGRIS